MVPSANCEIRGNYKGHIEEGPRNEQYTCPHSRFVVPAARILAFRGVRVGVRVGAPP